MRQSYTYGQVDYLASEFSALRHGTEELSRVSMSARIHKKRNEAGRNKIENLHHYVNSLDTS